MLRSALIAACFGLAEAGGIGSWGPTINFPITPVSATYNPVTGKLFLWSSTSPNAFGGTNPGYTYSTEYDPVTGNVSEAIITQTGHDMFCPGTSLGFDGTLVVTGGETSQKCSLRSIGTENWTVGGNLNIPRGYHASVTVSDGRVFTIGGSWSGGNGGKNGEIYSSATNSWTLLNGCQVGPMLTNDAQGVYRADNHGWLHAWKNGYVLQAGPSHNMNWYSTIGNGTQAYAGQRGQDTDAMNGVSVMYDAVNGKLFSAGGAPSYQNNYATDNAQVSTMGSPNTGVQTTDINKLWFARAFHNGVVLPDGKVLIVGGQSYPVPFSDDTSVLTPELWDPVSTNFIKLANGPTPRNYHSVAVLLPNGTVFSGGGGLCGSCDTNHPDGQIFTPPYLYNADGVTLAPRPVIKSVSSKTPRVGSQFGITLSAVPSSTVSFSLIRVGSTTHTVNTDQRRIPLLNGQTSDKRTYTFQLPSDPGVLVPGYYFAFALVNGVPSVASVVQVLPPSTVVAPTPAPLTNSFKVLSAFYGGMDVTSTAQAKFLQGNQLVIDTSDSAYPSDPWWGTHKSISILYTWQSETRIFSAPANTGVYTQMDTPYTAATAPNSVLDTPPAEPSGSYIDIVGVTWGPEVFTNSSIYSALYNASSDGSQVTVNNNFFGYDPLYGSGKTAIIWYYDSSNNLQSISTRENTAFTFPASTGTPFKVLSAYYANEDVTAFVQANFVKGNQLVIDTTSSLYGADPWPQVGKKSIDILYTWNNETRVFGAISNTGVYTQTNGAFSSSTAPNSSLANTAAPPSGSAITIVGVVWGGSVFSSSSLYSTLYGYDSSQTSFDVVNGLFGNDPLYGYGKTALFWYYDSSNTLRSVAANENTYTTI